VETPVNDTPKLDDADSVSFSDRARQRLRKIGAVIASIAALGAVVSGLSGYWNFWKTVKTDLFHQSQVGGKSEKIAISSGLIVSKGPSVAVLPVTNPAKATALEPVAATIARQLASSLGKFSTLRVMPRATAANFLKQDDTVEAARKAGVDYLVTGEIHPLGEGARASIQVADLHSGTEIWSKSFDASAEGVRTETDAYEIGDAAAAQIGGYPGAISIADYKKIQSKPVAELNSYQCIISAVVGGLIGSSSAGLRALECSKRLTEDEPNNALAWAARTSVLSNQRFLGYGLAPDQAQHVEKRLYLNEEIIRTATRAIELAPDDAYVRRLFALAIGTKCQIDLFRPEVQKALSLNSNDPYLGGLGISLAFMGDWDEGSAIAERAIRQAGSTNSSYSWWYGPAKRHWWRGEYQQALEDFRHAYLEGFWLSHLDAAYTLPFLGRLDDAKTEVTKLLKLRPDFTIREADAFYRMYCFSPEYIEKMNDALRQAGLPE
jgi:TolB-like protein